MGRQGLIAGIAVLAFSALMPMTASAATEYREGDPAIHREGDPASTLTGNYDEITISEEGEIVYYGKYASGEEPYCGYVDVDQLCINLTKPGVLFLQVIAEDIVPHCDEIVGVSLVPLDYKKPDYYLSRYINGSNRSSEVWTINGEGRGYTRMDTFLDAGRYLLDSNSDRVTPYQYRFYFYPFETTAPIRAVFGSPEGYAMRELGEEVSGGFTGSCFSYLEKLRDLENGEWSVWGNRITFDVPEDGYYKITLKANNAAGAELDTKYGSRECYVNPNRYYDDNGIRWDEWCMQEVGPELLNNFQTKEEVVALTAGTHTMYIRYNVTGSFCPFYSTCYTVKVEKTEMKQKEQEINVSSQVTQYLQNENFNLFAAAETELSYASDNTAVAEVSENGTVTLKSVGTAHIKVTAAETEEYKAAEATVTVVVRDIRDDDATTGDDMTTGGQGTTTGGTTSGGQTGTTGGTTSGGQGTTTGSQTGTTGGTATGGQAGTPTVSKQKISVKASFTKTFGSKAFSLNASAKGGAALSYSSSNKKVAVVSKTGKVTLKGMGKATITVKAAAVNGYPAAAAKVALTVNPKTPTGVKLTALSKKLKVNWKKVSKVKYQIQYTNKTKTKNKPNFTGAKSVSGAKPGAVLKSLKANSKYYVRVRAYSGSGKNRVYSAWSKTVSVKTKK